MAGRLPLRYSTRRSFLKQTSIVLAGAHFAPWIDAAFGQGGGEAIAETASGRVRGVAAQGVNVFKGIPYGASTAGANRFMPPVPPAAWTGVRDTLEYGPSAPQSLPGRRRAACARRERRLPRAERLHAGPLGQPETAGDGVAARRRVPQRSGSSRISRRRKPGAHLRRGRRQHQPSPERRSATPISATSAAPTLPDPAPPACSTSSRRSSG